jgi:hypothetical protein
VAVVELLEAEGRLLKRSLVRLSMALALVFVAACLSLVGLGFLVWSFYLFCAASLGPSGGAAVTGLSILFISLVIAWSAKKTNG